MKNKKILTFIAIIIFLQFFHINLRAQDSNIIEDEELPVNDPFQGGSATTSEDQSDPTNILESKSMIINSIRLVGTAVAGQRNFALISIPDGTTVVKREDDTIVDDIQLLYIDHDYIVVRLNAEENYEIYMNGQILPQEGN